MNLPVARNLQTMMNQKKKIPALRNHMALIRTPKTTMNLMMMTLATKPRLYQKCHHQGPVQELREVSKECSS